MVILKKLNVFTNKNYKDNVYVISRKSKSYSYFQSEFRRCSTDYEGDIIFPSTNPKEDGIVLSTIKNFFKEDETLSISKRDNAYDYFESECRKNISADNGENIIVSFDSYQKVKY